MSLEVYHPPKFSGRPSDQPDLRYKGQSGWKLPGSPMVKTWPSGSNPGQESRIPPTSRTEQQKKKKKRRRRRKQKRTLDLSVGPLGQMSMSFI